MRMHDTVHTLTGTKTHNLCTNMHTSTHTHVYKRIDVQIHTHMHIYTYKHVRTRTHVHIYTQKNDLCFGGPWQSWELAWTMNWVYRLRTSADKRMWSGRRAVVMRTGRRAKLLGVKLGCPRSRCRAVVSDVLCVRSYVHFVCVCVYMCMCVCVRT